MNYLLKAYTYKYIRIPIKFMISLMIVKGIGDAFYYCIFGTTVTLPRCNLVQTGQNPINPPMYQPYPFDNTIQNIQKRKIYDKLMMKIFKINFFQALRSSKMYTSHPARQNPNEIDQFLDYGNVNLLIQQTQQKVIKRIMDQSDNQMPQGINQLIRQLQQYRFSINQLLIPQL